MHGQRIGYVRVSSFNQNPERQLEHVQVDRLFTAHVRLVYKDERGEASVNSSVADRTGSGGTSASPTSLRCGTARSNSARSSSTRSSTIPERST